MTNRRLCSPCHYSCLSCSGASDVDCTSCHADSILWRSLGESHCVLKTLVWRMKFNVWDYWIIILLSINLLTIALTLFSCWKRRNASSYDYSKVAYSSNGNACKDSERLQGSTCMSDSE